MSKLAYRVVIEPLSDEDGGGYFATVPDLPGCMSEGETPDEAIVNAQDAIMCWLDAARERRMPVRMPTRSSDAAE